MRILRIVAWVMLCLTTSICAKENVVVSDIDRVVKREMQHQQIVGAAIGVIRDGKVVYARGYGKANLDRDVSVTTSTVFNWASNSKPVMAVAALQLVERGQLDLDVSIQKYLPDLPDTLHPVTTRHLLCHQSGIPHYANGEVVGSGQEIALSDQIDPRVSVHRFVNSPRLYEPGSKTTYSSYAYVLLSAVVQAAGREPIAEQLAHRITKPLGLRSFQLDLPYEGQSQWTQAYEVGKDGVPEPLADTAHFWKHGAGGYKSDIRDFANWATALMSGVLLREQTSAQMWQPQKLSTGDVTPYGLGVRVDGEGDRLKIFHGGSQDETKTRMVVYPERRQGVVVLCNTASAQPERITAAINAALE